MGGRTFPRRSCSLGLAAACWATAAAVDSLQCERATPMDPLSDVCCMNYGLACKVAFDCSAGDWNWKKGWSEGKKIHCCKTAGVGCSEHNWLQSLKFPAICVTLALLGWACGWFMWVVTLCWTTLMTADRRQCLWATPSSAVADDCCMKYGLACKLEFDCDAGEPNWERGWSSGKKEACCKEVGVGCEDWLYGWRLALCVALALLVLAALLAFCYTRHSKKKAKEPSLSPLMHEGEKGAAPPA